MSTQARRERRHPEHLKPLKRVNRYFVSLKERAKKKKARKKALKQRKINRR